MRLVRAEIPDVCLIEPAIIEDSRRYFYESWNRRTLAELGIDAEFVQDNHSGSRRNTLRGLHYQIDHAQGKLVRTVRGETFDVAVDLRRSSPTFGKWVSFALSADNKRLAWIPPGFAHGFCVVSETAEFPYKTTDYWFPEHERTILWDDPDLGIPWPLSGPPVLAPKDANGVRFADAETYA